MIQRPPGGRPPILVLTEREIRQCVTLDHEAIAAVEDGFTRIARGEVSVPPIIGIEVPERSGEVDVKTAYVRGLDSFAVKIASGFFSNAEVGLPNSSGLMVVISARTGFPEAVLLDNGYLTDVRTGIAGAIAAKHLARERIETVGVIGAGTQGRFQMRALGLVRPFQRLLVYDHSPKALATYVAEMPSILQADVVAASGVAAVVERSDIVVTSTPSRQPYVRAEWLHPGLHITAMGADSPEKRELHPEVLGQADRLVCDLKTQCFVRGEMHHALRAGVIVEGQVDELGELTAGRKPGRRRDAEITICDLTGVGVQDTAIALLAYRKALERKMGSSFSPER